MEKLAADAECRNQGFADFGQPRRDRATDIEKRVRAAGVLDQSLAVDQRVFEEDVAVQTREAVIGDDRGLDELLQEVAGGELREQRLEFGGAVHAVRTAGPHPLVRLENDRVAEVSGQAQSLVEVRHAAAPCHRQAAGVKNALHHGLLLEPLRVPQRDPGNPQALVDEALQTQPLFVVGFHEVECSLKPQSMLGLQQFADGPVHLPPVLQIAAHVPAYAGAQVGRHGEKVRLADGPHAQACRVEVAYEIGVIRREIRGYVENVHALIRARRSGR